MLILKQAKKCEKIIKKPKKHFPYFHVSYANKPVLTFQVNSCKVVLVPGGQVLQQVTHVHHVVLLINQI